MNLREAACSWTTRPVVAGIMAALACIAETATQAPVPAGAHLTIVDEARGLRLSGVVGTGVAWLRSNRDEILYWGLPQEEVGRIPVDTDCLIVRGCGEASSAVLLAAVHRDGRDRLIRWRPIGSPGSVLPLSISGRLVGLDVDASEGVVRALVLIRGVADSWVILRNRSVAESEMEASYTCPEGVMFAGAAQFGDSRTVVAPTRDREDPDATPSLTVWRRAADRWTIWKTIVHEDEGPEEQKAGFGNSVAIIRGRGGLLAGLACGLPWLLSNGTMNGGVAIYDKTLRKVAVIQGEEKWDELGFSCTAIVDQDGDGIEDYAVGAPQFVSGAHETGKGYVILMNHTGKELQRIEGLRHQEHFGFRVAGCRTRAPASRLYVEAHGGAAAIGRLYLVER